MPSIGPMEIMVVAVIALIVFGPQRLPEIARTVGRALNELKRQASDIRSEFESGLDLTDDPPPRDAIPAAMKEHSTPVESASVDDATPTEPVAVDEVAEADEPAKDKPKDPGTQEL